MAVDDDRECQRCGSTTTVKAEDGHSAASSVTPIRVCDDENCIWCVPISGGTRA